VVTAAGSRAASTDGAVVAGGRTSGRRTLTAADSAVRPVEATPAGRSGRAYAASLARTRAAPAFTTRSAINAAGSTRAWGLMISAAAGRRVATTGLLSHRWATSATVRTPKPSQATAPTYEGQRRAGVSGPFFLTRRHARSRASRARSSGLSPRLLSMSTSNAWNGPDEVGRANGAARRRLRCRMRGRFYCSTEGICLN
jgi:hypothetical protein